jgi:hypothetical protein
MRPTKLAVPIVLAVLALMLGVRLLTRRAPVRTTPVTHAARDAGRAEGRGEDVPGARTDLGATTADAGGADARDADARDADARDAGRAAPPVDPRRRALENQRRDAVAAQVYRDLLQRGQRVATVRAIDSGGGVRDVLQVQGAPCSDTFNREIVGTYPLGRTGYTLVTCRHPTTGDTFLTGVPPEVHTDGRPDAGARRP